MLKHSQNKTYRPFLSLLASISISLLTISCGCNNLPNNQNQHENQYLPTLKLQLIAQGPTYLVGDNYTICFKIEKAADSIAVDLSKLTLQPSRKLGNVAHLVLPNPDRSAQEVKDQDKIPVQALGGIGPLIKMGIEEGNDTETAFTFQLFYENKPVGNELTFTWRSALDPAAKALLAAIENLPPTPTKEDVDKIENLITKDNVNIADQGGKSLLYHAVKLGNPDIVQLLVDNGADVNAVDDLQETPLLLAAAHGHQKVVEQLLQAKADVNKVDSNQNAPLLLAAANGYQKVVKLLLEAQANVNAVNKFQETALWRAAANDYQAVVEQLLQANVDVNLMDDRGTTPLLWAASKGHQEIVRLLLLKKPASINTADNKGTTPLLAAIDSNHPAIVKQLLEHQVDVKIASKYGRAPLLWAAVKGNQEVVEQLLQAKADVNAVDNNQNTPLLLAVFKDHQEVVQKLLDSRAVIDQANKNDETPLYGAVSKGNKVIIQLLLKAGANPDLKVGDQTIRDLAETKGPDIQALFAPYPKK